MVYDFITKYTDIFVEKMKDVFSIKNTGIFQFLTLTKDVIGFEQLGPGLFHFDSGSLTIFIKHFYQNLPAILCQCDILKFYFMNEGSIKLAQKDFIQVF